MYRLPIFNLIAYANIKIQEMKKNNELIIAYKMGWNDCSTSSALKPEGKVFKDKGLEMAYQIGWSHYIIGDDVSSVDLKTEDEILKEIKTAIRS